jgi:hypothetical protein
LTKRIGAVRLLQRDPAQVSRRGASLFPSDWRFRVSGDDAYLHPQVTMTMDPRQPVAAGQPEPELLTHIPCLTLLVEAEAARHQLDAALVPDVDVGEGNLCAACRNGQNDRTFAGDMPINGMAYGAENEA